MESIRIIWALFLLFSLLAVPQLLGILLVFLIRSLYLSFSPDRAIA